MRLVIVLLDRDICNSCFSIFLSSKNLATISRVGFISSSPSVKGFFFLANRKATSNEAATTSRCCSLSLTNTERWLHVESFFKLPYYTVNQQRGTM